MIQAGHPFAVFESHFGAVFDGDFYVLKFPVFRMVNGSL